MISPRADDDPGAWNGPDAYAGGPLLAANGELPPVSVIERLRREHSPLIAADGAALRLRALGILPDIAIGDLDSIGDERRSLESAGVRVLEMESQEMNDLEKALGWIAGQAMPSATMIGVAGGAADHALNNISVITKFAGRLRLRICDAASTAYLVADSLRLEAEPGDRISLIPLPSAVVRTYGLAWPLHDERLAIGYREGASNRAVQPTIGVRVSQGVLLLFHFR